MSCGRRARGEYNGNGRGGSKGVALPRSGGGAHPCRWRIGGLGLSQTWMGIWLWWRGMRRRSQGKSLHGRGEGERGGGGWGCRRDRCGLVVG